MKRLILLTQFLTRLPIPVAVPAEDEDFNKSIVYFPVVGAIIGLLLAGITLVGLKVLDPLTTAVLVVIGEAVITGGLHLDGLADSFDGLYSYRSKERILEIMKDSRIGSNGVLALIGHFLLKVVFMNAVFGKLPIGQVCLLVGIMPVMARMMIVFASWRGRYARPSGMGNYFIGRVSLSQLGLALVISIAIGTLEPISLIALVVLILASELYVRHCRKIIDGMTGDTLGALCEMSSTLYWVVLLVAVKVGLG